MERAHRLVGLGAGGARRPAGGRAGCWRTCAAPRPRPGLLPERVGAATGIPRSTTPLGWSHAFSSLALEQLFPPPRAGGLTSTHDAETEPCSPLLGIAALALAGCGSSGPKRTVDARAEALRFFPANAPLVALLDTAPEIAPERAALAAELAGFGPWESIRSSFLARLSAAGLPLGGLAALLRSEDPEPEDGLPLSQLAVGLEPGSGPAEPRVLVVLVTDQTGAMARLFTALGGERAAALGGRAGRGADLRLSPDLLRGPRRGDARGR